MKPEEIESFFESQFELLIEENDKLKSSTKEELFLYLCLKYYFFENDPSYDTEDIFDSMFEDKYNNGINAICLDLLSDETPQIVFVQSIFKNELDPKDVSDGLKKLTKSYQQLRKKKFESFDDKLVERFEYCVEEAEIYNPCFVFFSYTTPKKAKKEKILALFKEANALIYFGEDIKCYIEGELEKTGRVSSGEIEIDTPNNYLSYEYSCIVNLSAKSLKSLYGTYRRGLLGLNLRYYIRNKTVDTGIKNTIQKNPNHFWYLNNGIVIACEDYSVSGRIVKLSGFSIINGGQTTDRIFNTDFEDDFYLLCKIIKTDMNDDEGDPNKLSSRSISIASNSQKPIKDKDLVSNKPEQIRLKAELKQLGVQYVIKAGETIEKKYKATGSYISLDTLGKLGMFAIAQHPWARSNSKDIFDQTKGFYHLIYKEAKSSLYKDLLILDNYYKRYIKSKEIPEDVSKLAKNSRSFVLAIIALCSLIIQKPEYYERLQNFKDSKTQNELAKAIGQLDCIIVNKFDDEKQKYYAFFNEINIDLINTEYRVVSRYETDLNESNYLKKADSYYEIVKALYHQLRPSSRIMRPSAEILFEK